MQQAALLALLPLFLSTTTAYTTSHLSNLYARNLDLDTAALLLARVDSRGNSPERTAIPYTSDKHKETIGNKLAGGVDKLDFHGDKKQKDANRADALRGVSPEPGKWRDEAKPASTKQGGGSNNPVKKVPPGEQQSEGSMLGKKQKEALEKTGGRAQATYDGKTLDQVQGNVKGGHNLRKKKQRSLEFLDTDLPVLSRRQLEVVARDAAADAIAEALEMLEIGDVVQRRDAFAFAEAEAEAEAEAFPDPEAEAEPEASWYGEEEFYFDY